MSDLRNTIVPFTPSATSVPSSTQPTRLTTPTPRISHASSRRSTPRRAPRRHGTGTVTAPPYGPNDARGMETEARWWLVVGAGRRAHRRGGSALWHRHRARRGEQRPLLGG